MNLLAVALGGMLGALGRYGATQACQRWLGTGFPWGTLGVNVLGCLALGYVAALSQERLALDGPQRLFLQTGLLGAFTTFSTFSLEALELWRGGSSLAAAGYVLGSLALGLVAVAVGHGLAQPAV